MTTLEIKTAINKYEARSGHRLEPIAFLFDMDGVLYDSMPHHERSWLETAQHFALQMNTEDVYMFEGQTGPQTISILMQRSYQREPTPQEIRDIYELKTKLFTKYNNGDLIPNAKLVVASTAPFKRIIVTGSSQASLLDKLNDNFPDTFSRQQMVTGLDVQRGKPHPEPYLRGLALAQAEPWQGIVVENAPQGVRAAHSAGCFTIAVNTGPLADEVLWREGADLVFPDMFSLNVALPTLLSLLA